MYAKNLETLNQELTCPICLMHFEVLKCYHIAKKEATTILIEKRRDLSVHNALTIAFQVEYKYMLLWKVFDAYTTFGHL